jgi:cytochrome P450
VESNDLLSMLLTARDEETGEGLDDRELKAEAAGLFAAGHETSASALTWTLYFLSKHPDVRKKLQGEVHHVLRGEALSPAHLGQLTYARYVIQESMRLRPPVWLISRDTLENDRFGAYPIPRRSIIFLSPFLTHRHPRHWPNPEGFEPERFTPQMEAERPALSYFPFGAGGHKCIGQGFAMMEMQLIIAALAQNFELDLLPGIEPQLDPAITLRPKGEVPMVVRAL